MLDLLIVNVPGTITLSPPSAPAILKASILQSGFSCKTVDFNIRFYNEIDIDTQNLETYFITGLNDTFKLPAEQLIEKWALEIILHNPRFVGISVFT